MASLMFMRSTWIPAVAPSTDSPTISSVSVDGTTISWVVKNNDELTATVKSEVSDPTPDLNSISLATGATRPQSQVVDPVSLPFSIYATALASGKTISETVSYYYEGY